MANEYKEQEGGWKTARGQEMLQLPKISQKKPHQGFAWSSSNPAIRQLSSLYRVRSAPKYYPLGLWHHQKDPEFPEIRDTCLITASRSQRSRSSCSTPHPVQEESKSDYGKVESLPAIKTSRPSSTVSGHSDHAEGEYRTRRPGSTRSNNYSSTKDGASRGEQFRHQKALSGDEFLSGSSDEIRSFDDQEFVVDNARDLRTSSGTSSRNTEFTKDVFAERQDEIQREINKESYQDKPAEGINEVNHPIHDKLKPEAPDDFVLDANERNEEGRLPEDGIKVEPGEKVNDRLEERISEPATEPSHSGVIGSSFEEDFQKISYPPINTVYLCLIIGTGVDADLMTSFWGAISKCRCELIDEGYDLAVMTLNITDLADTNPNVRREIIMQYLSQCRDNGLGPFFYALFSEENREESQEPPLSIDYDIFRQLTDTADGQDDNKSGILQEWYKLDKSANPPVYRLKSLQEIIQYYSLLSRGGKPDENGSYVWKKQKRQLCEAFTDLQSSAADTIPRIALDSVFTSVLQMVEEAVMSLPDSEFGATSRRQAVADLSKGLSKDIERGRTESDDLISGDTNSHHKDSATDEDSSVSRSVTAFTHDVVTSVQVINKRRTTDRGRSARVSCEHWSHHQRIIKDIPASFVEACHELLIQIRERMLDPNNSLPVVVQTQSTQSRFLLLSHLAKVIKHWIVPSPYVVMRFTGHTERSSRLDGFIEAIWREINEVYGCDEHIVPSRDVVRYTTILRTLLDKVSKQDGPEKPVVLLLDGVDTTEFCSRWLSSTLPDNVYMVLTVPLSPTSDKLNADTVNYLIMESEPDIGHVDESSKFLVDVERAESLVGSPDTVKDILNLLTVNENGLTDDDMTSALQESSRSGFRSDARLTTTFVVSVLSPWIQTIYDSGKLLRRLPKRLHSVVMARYTENGEGPDQYLRTVVQVYGKPPDFDCPSLPKSPGSDGLRVLLCWRLLAFVRCLSDADRSRSYDVILQDTLFSFPWLACYIGYLSVPEFISITWPLRHLDSRIRTLCLLLESYFVDVTDVATVAAGLLASLSGISDDCLFVCLRESAEKWLTGRGPALVPCSPTLGTPRMTFPVVPGPGHVLHVTDDGQVVVWGRSHGLQVWNMKDSACVRQLAYPPHWPAPDITINGLTNTVYYTEETYLVGWNITDGTPTLRLDLLPNVSQSGRRFNNKKDMFPFLTVADVSPDGRLVAVKINHSEMLKENKGVVLVSTENGGTVTGLVGDGMFGPNLTNVKFTNDGQVLTITRKPWNADNDPRIVFFNTDLSSEGRSPEICGHRTNGLDTAPSSGQDGNGQCETDKKTTKEEDDNTIKHNERRSPETKSINEANNNGSSIKETEVNPSSDTKEVTEEIRSDSEHKEDESDYNDTLAAQEMTSDKGTAGDDVITEQQATDKNHSTNSERQASDERQTEHRQNKESASYRRERVRRQEAVDAGDGEAGLDDHPPKADAEDADKRLSPTKYDFVVGSMERCRSENTLYVACAPNGVVRVVPNEMRLQPLCEIADAGLFRIVEVLCLADGTVVSVHSQGLGRSPLMLCIRSDQLRRLYLEHRGVFRFVRRAEREHSVVIVFHNKIVFMDVTLQVFTHALDFPQSDVTSVQISESVLYVGTGDSVVTRELARYEVTQPHDYLDSLSESVTLEGDEDVETIQIITLPPEKLPAEMTSFGPLNVSHAVLLPGGQRVVVGVAGRLKLMDVSDGSLQEMSQDERTILLDVFLVGPKCDSLVALENDSTSNGLNILRWKLDAILSKPEVINCKVAQTKWRLSSKKNWLISLSRHQNKQNAELCAINLGDLRSDAESTIVIEATGKHLNFAISDSGQHLALWDDKPETIVLYRLSQGHEGQTTEECPITEDNSKENEANNITGSWSVSDNDRPTEDELKEKNQISETENNPKRETSVVQENQNVTSQPGSTERDEGGRKALDDVDKLTLQRKPRKIEIGLRARSEAVLITEDLLIVGSKEGFVYRLDMCQLFDAEDGQNNAAATLRSNCSKQIKDSPQTISLADEDILIILSAKGYVILMNIHNLKEQVTLENRPSKVSATVLSKDHSMLVASYADGTMRLWNAISGQELCTVPTQTTIHWLSFIQNDNTVLAWIDKYKAQRSRFVKYDIKR